MKPDVDERTKELRKAIWIAGLTVAIVAGLAWRAGFVHAGGERAKMPPSLRSLEALLTSSPDVVRGIDVAQMNLLCVQDLPGTFAVETDGALRLLQEMANRAKSETERHEYRFKQNPAEFEDSEGFFRMVMLGVVLAEDFRVKYAPGKVVTAADARVGDGFFSDASAIFLNGLLGPRREGTCSSMPVLYLAVGRRLGYPLKLVTTKSHLFVRWEDFKERFNIETTGRGVNRFPDEYYRHWPLAVTDEEIAAEGYLKSLSPAEELAVFLSIRGMCLQEVGRYADAAAAFGGAARFAPGCRSYGLMQVEMQRKAGNTASSTLAAKKEREAGP
jgi:hypothetical protein